MNMKEQEDIQPFPVIVPNCACIPILILSTYCLLFRLQSDLKESLKSVNSCTIDLASRVNFISNTIHECLVKNLFQVYRDCNNP